MQVRARHVAWVVPSLALVPLLTARVPVTIHGMREIAGYFQALAIARTGIESYLYLTPQESFSSLHLHSVLSSPLVAAGYVEGGRLVSLLGAVAAAAAVSLVAAEIADRRAALLAPALLWAQPMFVRHAWVFQPETLSIALTSGAILATLRYVRTDDRRWLAATAALLVFGPTNHMWEATILLPVVVVLLWDRRTLAAVAVGAATVVAAGSILWIVSLQPEGPSTLTSHGIHAVGPSIFASPDFWTAHLSFHRGFPAPYGLALTVLLPASLVACLSLTYRVATERTRRDALLAAWLASGLAIPVLLASGYSAHYYYLWGLLAPFSILLAVAGSIGLDRLTADRSVTVDDALRAAVAVLIVGSMSYALVFQTGVLGGSGLPTVTYVEGEEYDRPAATQAGLELRQLDPEPDELLFVGDWEHDFSRQSGRTAVYSDVLFRQRTITAPGGPDLVDETNGTGCEDPATHGRVVVRKTDESIEVTDCRNV